MSTMSTKQNTTNIQLKQYTISQRDERYSSTAQMEQALFFCNRLTLGFVLVKITFI